MRHLLGIDVGGTFTDFVAYDGAERRIEVWKELSVPADPVVGILNGLARYPDRADVENIRLGTTVATNAVLERKGAVVAYVTTKGFRDVPFIQRGNRKAHYDMSWVKPKPLVKRRHCFELDERVDAYGAVIQALDEAEVRAVAAAIRGQTEIAAVAVCLLFSYLEPGARAGGEGDPAGGAAGACRSRSPTRSCRSGRSTSAPPPRWPTPISSRSCRGSCARCAGGSTRVPSPRTR